jgi:hypothetical protein
LLRTRCDELPATGLKPALLHRLALFAEAGELDPGRTRRWAQARATYAALSGRMCDDPPWLIELTDQIACALT